MQKPDICIYHGPCPDGFTAAWAVWRKFGNDVEYIEAKYGDPIPNVDHKHVLLVDFSYKRDQMLALTVRAESVTILDHHISAQKDIGDMLQDGSVSGIFDMDRSGAGIAWDWCFPDTPRPVLITYVEDRDLWRFKYSVTEPFCAALDMEERTFKTWEHILHVCKTNGLINMIERGETLVKKFNKDADAIMVSTLQWFEIDGHVVPVCNAPFMYASRIGNELAKNHDAPFAATFFINPEGYKLFSLRSLDSKVNVSEVAVKFGGGGHRNASGFRVGSDFEFNRIAK